MSKYKHKDKIKTRKRMNDQFSENVYNFTNLLLEALVKEFDGKVIGSNEANLETLMKFHFPEYSPGNPVKKKKAKGKPRALSGYTYFGQQNKEKFNEAMKKMDEKPKYVNYVADKWKALSQEKKDEWGQKAKDVFEATKSDDDDE